MMKTSQKAFLSTIIIISINILIGYCLRVSLFSILFLQFMSFIVYIIVYFGTAHYKNKPTNYHQIMQIMQAHLKIQYKALIVLFILSLSLMFYSPYPNTFYFVCNLIFVMLQSLHMAALNGLTPKK